MSVDADLSRYRYPQGPRPVELGSRGQDLRTAYILTKSEQGSRRTIVLLHGKNSPGAYWEPMIHEFITHGFHVIAPDRFGFVKSPNPRTCQITFATLVENTQGLLAHLEVDRAQVIGHSMGGMFARFARVLADRTEKLVLVSPIGLEKGDALPHDLSEFGLLTVSRSNKPRPADNETVQRVAEPRLSKSVRKKLGDYLAIEKKSPPRSRVPDS